MAIAPTILCKKAVSTFLLDFNPSFLGVNSASTSEFVGIAELRCWRMHLDPEWVVRCGSWLERQYGRSAPQSRLLLGLLLGLARMMKL